MMMNYNDTKIAAEDVDEFINKALYQHDPMTLGSLMIIRGLGIFKSLIDAEQYDVFCRIVYNDRNNVINYFKE